MVRASPAESVAIYLKADNRRRVSTAMTAGASSGLCSTSGDGARTGRTPSPGTRSSQRASLSKPKCAFTSIQAQSLRARARHIGNGADRAAVLYSILSRRQDTESFIVSLGIEGAHVELELEEAVAYAQRRENFLRV